MNHKACLESLRTLKNLINEPEDVQKTPEWRSMFVAAYDELSVAAGIVQLDHRALGPLDYVANILHEYEKPGTKWILLKPEIQEEYRQKAINTVALFATEQIEAKREDERFKVVPLIPRRSN